jgi:hypothetical protein
MAECVGRSLDAQRFEQDYPEQWRQRLRDAIVREIKKAVHEATREKPNALDT